MPTWLTSNERARIRVWDRHTGAVRTVFESRDCLYEAPNWTADDRLLVNGDGKLWLLPVDGSAPPREITTEGLPDVNNDHVLAADGTTVFASATIHTVGVDGQDDVAVTTDPGPGLLDDRLRDKPRTLTWMRTQPPHRLAAALRRRPTRSLDSHGECGRWT